eukprot:CAMPEP_0194153540 /NCGR_PEP_ID=MMETSP0152-20130528/56758_1 /TAXON_ID=1049557 /ORGANISM="Thalassiothrix antarctica, Strain L6-D1" /LENGTH=864 /DNA_ID=CAMNT_0038858883 /DNA_START=97 /DNA_END=2691 /DNA_ORIENTATION=-
MSKPLHCFDLRAQAVVALSVHNSTWVRFVHAALLLPDSIAWWLLLYRWTSFWGWLFSLSTFCVLSYLGCPQGLRCVTLIIWPFSILCAIIGVYLAENQGNSLSLSETMFPKSISTALLASAVCRLSCHISTPIFPGIVNRKACFVRPSYLSLVEMVCMIPKVPGFVAEEIAAGLPFRLPLLIPYLAFMRFSPGLFGSLDELDAVSRTVAENGWLAAPETAHIAELASGSLSHQASSEQQSDPGFLTETSRRYPVIVVGSGPVATAFVQRWLEKRDKVPAKAKKGRIREDQAKNIEILWIEEGAHSQTIDGRWPEMLVSSKGVAHEGVVFVPNASDSTRSTLFEQQPLRFSCFGGGLALNSGGPLSCVDVELPNGEKIGPENQKQALAALVQKHSPEHLISATSAPNMPQTISTSDLSHDQEVWFDEFKRDQNVKIIPDYVAGKFLNREPGVGGSPKITVSSCASTHTERNKRCNLAEVVLLEEYPTRIQMEFSTKVDCVLFADTASCQRESGGEKPQAIGVKAMDGRIFLSDVIVLGGGVFGTFEMLLRSGIGPEATLNVKANRDLRTPNLCVTKQVIIPNPSQKKADAITQKCRWRLAYLPQERVGQCIGCDDGIVIPIEHPSRSEMKDQQNISWEMRVPPSSGVPSVHISCWPRGTFEFMYLSLGHYSFLKFLIWVTRYQLKRIYFLNVNFESRQNQMLYFNNGKVELKRCNDLSGHSFTNEGLQLALRSIWRKIDSSRSEKSGLVGFWDYCFLNTTAKVFRLMGYASCSDQDGFFGCVSKQPFHKYHYYGGSAQTVNPTHFEVKGTKGLFIADASVVARMEAGPPTPSLVALGYHIADHMIKHLRPDAEGNMDNLCDCLVF